VLHFWIALSVNQSISLPDGGEAVAQVVTLLLVLVSCNDRRTWHWQRPADVQHRDSVWQGIGWAGHWGLRLQMAYIYLNASVAKTAVDDWSDGTALYYVFRGEYFGARGLFSQVFLWISANPFGALALAWGTILGEGLIALFILGGRRRQRLALALSLLLHVGIIVGIGLWTFGLIMIGGILAAAAPSLDPPAADGRPGPARPEPDPERVEEPAQVLSSA
jgi:antimicrobial peptide system SdpB family protein